MPISKMFVVRFFQLIKGRRFAEAERVLERIRKKTNETEWNSGYLHALDGILLAQKSNDSYAFIKKLDFEDEKQLKNFRKDFLAEYKNKIHSDNDRGFFAAWADYMLILKQSLAEEAKAEATDEVKAEATDETKAEATDEQSDETAEKDENA
jgi:nitrate/TMAO reductase-like tetraheme cytochrome c subunit